MQTLIAVTSTSPKENPAFSAQSPFGQHASQAQRPGLQRGIVCVACCFGFSDDEGPWSATPTGRLMATGP